MSLLIYAQDPEFQRLTDEIFARQLTEDPRLQQELDNQTQQKMYEDVQYNVDFLYTALQLEDDGLYERYARWLYQLLIPMMTYCTRERVRDIMLEHYQLIRICMEKTIAEDKRPKLHRILDSAVQATIDECAEDSTRPLVSEKYEAEIQRYLEHVLQANTKGVLNLVTEYVKAGIPLNTICVDIITEALRRVGELWHQHQISVDMEHYATTVTQMALAQLYPIIFSQPRKNKTIVVACVGSELHELGPRMVADLFEYDGWDSIYLGAAVSHETLQAVVAEQKPDLVALSVTMPQHLLLCQETVKKLREAFPAVKIAVGGQALEKTTLWQSWGADIYTKTARELVIWADETL